MDRNRLLELAIEGLEKQKTAIDEEISAIRAELRGAGSTPMAKPVAAPISGRRHRTPAERKAQSLRMKQYWAKKRQGSKKISLPKAKTARATLNKAISDAMKAAWARRKAKAAGKTAKAKPRTGKVSPKPSES